MKLVQEKLIWSVRLPFPRMGKALVLARYCRESSCEGGIHLTMRIVSTDEKHLMDNSFKQGFFPPPPPPPPPFLRSISLS